jgi:tetratricopeptide (TPR) repeat protein
LREGIAKDAPDDWTTYRDIASTQNDLGEYFMSISQPQEALDRFSNAQENADEALGLVKDDAKALKEINWRRARVLVSLSQVYEVFKQKEQQKDQRVTLGEAQKAALEKALEIRKNLYEANQDDREIKRDLSWTYHFLGTLAFDDEEFNLAEQYFQQSFKLRQEASTNDPSDRAKSDLAWAELNYGNVLRRLKHYDEAKKQLMMASDLMREVAAKDKPNLVRHKDFCMTQASLGDLEMDLLKPNEALDYYQEASGILENLINMSDKPLFRIHLGNVYDKTGRAMLLAGNPSAATEAFDKALQLRNPSYSKQHDGVEFQTELAQAHCSLGELQAKRDERSSARASYHKCEELAREEKPAVADRLLDQATKALKALPERAAKREQGKLPSKH